MSEKNFKNVMLRLKNDDYVKLKALAEHQRTSMNSAVINSINESVENAQETGLYLDESLLEEPKKKIKRVPNYMFQEHFENTFTTNSGAFKEAGTSDIDHYINHARTVMRDWVNWHAKVRVALLQLGLSIESVDSNLANLLDPNSDGFITNYPDGFYQSLISVRGLPALRSSSNNCIEQSRKLMNLLQGTEVARQILDSAVSSIDKTKNNERKDG